MPHKLKQFRLDLYETETYAVYAISRRYDEKSIQTRLARIVSMDFSAKNASK